MEIIKFIKDRLESLYEEKESLTNRHWVPTNGGESKSSSINTINILIKEYEDILNNKQLMRDYNISTILKEN